jgi:hypothetical protein
VTEIVAVPPVAIVASEQVMLEVPVHVPWDALLAPAIVPGGTAMVATAFVAATGPRFVTVLVNVTGESAVTDVGEGVCDTVSSAPAGGPHVPPMAYACSRFW